MPARPGCCCHFSANAETNAEKLNPPRRNQKYADDPDPSLCQRYDRTILRKMTSEDNLWFQNGRKKLPCQYLLLQ